MTDAQTNITDLEDKLDGALIVLSNARDGYSKEEINKARDDLGSVLSEVVKGPISNPAQANILRNCLSFLLAEEPEPFLGSPDEAIDSAFEQALAFAASPRQTALLAFIRYRFHQLREFQFMVPDQISADADVSDDDSSVFDFDDNDSFEEYLESDEFESLYEDLWKRAVSASGHHIDELDLRERIPSPEYSLARQIIGMEGNIPLKCQEAAFRYAADMGEDTISRIEIELEEMRRAVVALRQPRPELLRSRIGLVKPSVTS